MAQERTNFFFNRLVAAVLVACAVNARQSFAQPTGQPPGGSTGQPGSSFVPAAPVPNAVPEKSSSDTQLPDGLFDRLDKNRDKAIAEGELKAPEAADFVARLKLADRNNDGRITREEFDRARATPFFRDPHTAAAILLILGFAGFCMFLDGLLDPGRRDYFWLSLGCCVVLTGVAYLFAAAWFQSESPYLAYVAAVPVVVLVIAWLSSATNETENEATDPTKQVVYKVGSATTGAVKPAAGKPPVGKPASGAATVGTATSGASAAAPTGTAPPRRPAPPQRTPRPAPVPRPPVPERRPAPISRLQPPRSPGTTQPPGGTKPPPGGAKPPPG